MCEYDDITPCCGNGECESGESSITCPGDCYVEGELRLWIVYPNNGTTYFRGNVTQISAQLNYGSHIVNDGEVNCLDPSGGYFSLEFGASLYYSYDYSITRSDPSGIWGLRCNASAFKDGENKYDSDHVMLEIRDRLVIRVSELNDFYLQGEEVKIRVNVSYDNGTAASGVDLIARTPEGNATLEDVGDGVYELSYIINSLGSVNISLAALDLTGTTTSTGLSILSVKPFSPIDYFWLIPVVLVSGVVLFFGRRRMIRMRVEKGLEDEITSKQNRMAEIVAEKKRLQDEFLQTRITEMDFKESMKALDTEYQRIDLDLKELNKKGPLT